MGNRADELALAPQDPESRRLVRSTYIRIKNDIREKQDDISSVDSNKFDMIISEVEELHKQVQKPREQMADGEALLDLAKIVKSSAKSYTSEGVTPSDFISSLLRKYSKTEERQGTSQPALNSIFLKEIGFSVSPVFKKFQGCCTMLGPMQTEAKQRKVAVYRKRVKPTLRFKPEELENKGQEKTDTDKNISTMFEILTQKKSVKLESLILNKKSFAQTVENLFALSFLVKDGRVELSVDEKGSHLASPRNAPDARSIMSGEEAYSHFVFRYDFNDWKLMLNILSMGEELMPHRDFLNNSRPQEGKPTATNDLAPVKKLARNYGLFEEQEQPFVDSPEIADGIRRCKPKLL